MRLQQAVFPLILIPVLLAVGLAAAPRLTLRILGWFIALNLLLVGCILAAQRPQAPEAVRRRAQDDAIRAQKHWEQVERNVGR